MQPLTEAEIFNKAWTCEELPLKERQFRWMMIMKHFDRQLEEMQRELFIRERQMKGQPLYTEEDMEDEDGFHYKITAEEVEQNPWPLKCLCVMTELRTYIDGLAAEVALQHQYARRLAYTK